MTSPLLRLSKVILKHRHDGPDVGVETIADRPADDARVSDWAGAYRPDVTHAPPPSDAGRRYALAIFLSSLLLFLIEPIAGKRILPLLGGSAAVWTACLVFFQS